MYRFSESAPFVAEQLAEDRAGNAWAPGPLACRKPNTVFSITPMLACLPAQGRGVNRTAVILR
jgi:hypothetical protein